MTVIPLITGRHIGFPFPGLVYLSNMTRFFQNWQIVFQAPLLQVGLQVWQKIKSPDTLEEPHRR
jgi:hypothetical protein